MTYEEENSDKTYSVWRLVKVPQKMLENTKKAVKSGKPVYRELADKIRRLETENRQKEADALRRSVAAGTDIKALKQRLKKLSTTISEISGKIRHAYLVRPEIIHKEGTVEVLMELDDKNVLR